MERPPMADYRYHPRDEAWDRVAQIIGRLERLESNMAVSQADLDQLAAALTADDAAIQSEIATLQAANPNLDLTGLQAAVAATAALVPATVTPVSTDPGTPVVTDPSAPADGSAPAAS